MEYALPIDASASAPNFILYFIRRSGFATLRPLGSQGELGRLGIRLNSWRVFLNIFHSSSPLETWLDTLSEHRSHYNTLQNSYKQTDPLLGDSKFLIIQSEISKDLSRTFQTHKFFQSPTTQSRLLSILSIWATTHDLGYLQGMSEIASLIYLQVFSERCEDKSNVLFNFNNAEYVEHDTYLIFDKILEAGLKDMFVGEKQEKSKRNVFIGFMQDIRNIYSKEDIVANPLIRYCNEVGEVYLKIIDKECYEFFKENDIEAHLFLTRWFRCMFVRETTLSNALVLWDFILSAVGQPLNTSQGLVGELDGTKELVMLKFVALAMILFVRNQLTSDVSQILKRLTTYPPIEDIKLIIELAINCKQYLMTGDSSFKPDLPPLTWPKSNKQIILNTLKHTSHKFVESLKSSQLVKKLNPKKRKNIDLNTISLTQWTEDSFTQVDCSLKLIDQISSNLRQQLQQPLVNHEILSKSIRLLNELKHQIAEDI